MTQGSFERTMSSHYKDLRGIYAKRMECHGVGMALMHPMSGEDCQPVSCGYFDRNGDWNLITRLTADDPRDLDDYFYPLEYQPKPVAPVEITWQPKTSLGVSALTVDASGETPDGLPAGAGADVHIRYSSNSKFGAVLMTTKPVTLRAYNDEALFCSWLSRNQGKLYDRYGPELKKYGMWIVTRTYTTRQASINAWMDKKKDQTVSLKAKAAMLGELGEDLDWRDKASDKDWSHYTSKTPHGVVVFMDGIEVRPVDWWLEGVRSQVASSSSDRGRRLLRYMPDPVHHQATFDTHNWGKSLHQIDRESAQQQRASFAESQRRASAAPASSASPRRHSISAALSPHRRSLALSPHRRSIGAASASPPPQRPLSGIEMLKRRPSDKEASAPPGQQPQEQHHQEQPQEQHQDQQQKRHSSAGTSSQLRPDSGIDIPKVRDWHPHAQQHHAHKPHSGEHAAAPRSSHDATEPAAAQHKRASPSGDHAVAAPKHSSNQASSATSSSPSPRHSPQTDLHNSQHSAYTAYTAHSHDSAYEFHSRSTPQHAGLGVPVHARRKVSGGMEDLVEVLGADEETLKDAGLSSLSRASSIRMSSAAPSIRSQRSMTHSLRRETRSISQEPE